jgi:hypothetical protein
MMTSKTVPDKKLKAPPVSANGLAKLMFWRKRGSSQIMFGLNRAFHTNYSNLSLQSLQVVARC